MVKLTWIDELNNTEFVSSSEYTDQFKKFYTLFKKEMTAFLKSIGATNIEINRGHFNAFGFFTFKDKVWYFSLGDVRFDKSFFIRKAKNYKDYTGETNIDLPLKSERTFIDKFVNAIGK